MWLRCTHDQLDNWIAHWRRYCGIRNDLFINLAFENFRKAGQDGYRSITVWVWSVTPFEVGNDRGSFSIFRDLGQFEREVEQTGNRVATMAVDNFRKGGSRLSSPADL